MNRAFLTLAFLVASLATAQESSRFSERVQSGPAPWGELEVSEVPLALPDRAIRILDIPSSETEWIFEQPTMEELRLALSEKSFTAGEISYLLDSANVMLDPTAGVRVYPEDSLIRDMPFELRQKLYRTLGENPRNRFHHRPLFMNTGNVSDWFRDSGIPRSVQDDVARIAYPTPSKRGFFISDVSFLLRQTENSAHEQLLLKGLMRHRSLMVRLKLNSDSDLAALSDYWTAGFKNKDILPMMESVAKAKNIDRIDIVHLLPPTPRRNLLTHPDLEEGASGHFPDWFWTCFNFFRFTPVEIYADSEGLEALIAREFSLGLPPFQFGDMLAIREGGKAIHGCIYIADDIVFTKNSADIFSPWLLMRMGDVLAYHDFSGNAEVTIHRKRPVPLP